MTAHEESRAALSPIKQAFLALEELQAKLDAVERDRTEPIAVIGMACRFPGADDPEAFWRLLRDGVDAIGPVPADRWDMAAYYHPDPDAAGKTYAQWGGYLAHVDRFDAAFFGIAPREAARMDPQQRLLLEIAWEALEDAGLPPARLAGSPTGVFAGLVAGDYLQLQLSDPAQIDAYTGTGVSNSVAAGRLSYLLDVQGPSLAVDTACSSGLVATHLACQSLRVRECTLALAGAVHLLLSPLSAGVIPSKMRLLAEDGRCKAFDARADGIGVGEGCGMVVLKRLSDALADGDRILALIRGSAVNQDGHSNGLTAPSGLAQEAVIRQALANAGVAGERIGYVEAHGTGTPLGDPIEVEALHAALGRRGERGTPCLLGSAKTNIGHLGGAAGIAGLIKVVLSLIHGEVPPHLHFSRLNPNIALNGTSFVIPTDRRSWPSDRGGRYAGVSAFGWAGTNAHMILEQAPAVTAQAEQETARQAYLLPLSARSSEALRCQARVHRDHLAAASAELLLHDVCYTATVRRSHHEYRLAVVGASRSEIVGRLDSFLATGSHAGISSGRAGARRPGLAFVFSGQGAQWAGMGTALLQTEPAFRSALEECDALLRRHARWSLLEEIVAEPTRSRLDATEIAQPVIVALQLALVALWRSWGITAEAVAGHSVGEISAACVAGALSLDEAMQVAYHRGRLMEAAAGQGQMAAVALPAAEARAVVARYGERLALAATNSPTSTVLSGDPTTLAEALAILKRRGVECR
ncbi:MAG TPA: type I polyketide synthase, partial [Chloroflexota bacterium]|nr:type I polyketide synthase [Chloroflexota bacterium]